MTHLKFKLAPRHYSPFQVKERIGPLTYHLEILKTWKIHPVFHASVLTQYYKTEAHGKNYPKPAPEILNEEEHYKVKYLVKWVKYPEVDNTWKPFALLKGMANKAL